LTALGKTMSTLGGAVLKIADLDEGHEIDGHTEPNSDIEMPLYKGYKGLYAGKDILAGSVIFALFNYLTTEYELAAPFQCECGSAKCFGSIRGYKFLTADQLAELLPVTSMTTSSN